MSRLQDLIQRASLKEILSHSAKQSVVFVQHPDDEGVRNNNGRPGAKRGPKRILYYFERLVVRRSPFRVFVLKDIAPSKKNLAARHEWAEDVSLKLLKKGFRVISLGGGHDYGYPNAAAYFQVHKSKIINVDAHLDVRELDIKKINSGTPFFRFAERFGGNPITQWGIQSQFNSDAHIEYAKKSGMTLLGPAEPMPNIDAEDVGLSICLDAFTQIRGVSAPSFFGLDVKEGLNLVRHYQARSSWLGLYESAPRLDTPTEDSARLAAIYAYNFIYPKEKTLESRLFS